MEGILLLGNLGIPLFAQCLKVSFHYLILVIQLPNDTLILGCGLNPLEVWGQAARQRQYCLDMVMCFFYTLVICIPILWDCHFRQGKQVIAVLCLALGGFQKCELLLDFSKVQEGLCVFFHTAVFLMGS